MSAGSPGLVPQLVSVRMPSPASSISSQAGFRQYCLYTALVSSDTKICVEATSLTVFATLQAVELQVLRTHLVFCSMIGRRLAGEALHEVAIWDERRHMWRTFLDKADYGNAFRHSSTQALTSIA